MKPQYLFLYPVREYFEHVRFGAPVNLDKVIPGLMNIIDARYRSDHEINWLLFGQLNAVDIPDKTAVPIQMRIKSEDRILSNGITWEAHMDRIYPNVTHILDNLPPHTRLVIGGFHQDDCVDKVAKASYERGVDTFVDEDTTHMGIMVLTSGKRKIPLTRTKWTIRGYKGNRMMNDPLNREHIMNCRKNKPWLAQEIG